MKALIFAAALSTCAFAGHHFHQQASAREHNQAMIAVFTDIDDAMYDLDQQIFTGNLSRIEYRLEVVELKAKRAREVVMSLESHEHDSHLRTQVIAALDFYLEDCRKRLESLRSARKDRKGTVVLDRARLESVKNKLLLAESRALRPIGAAQEDFAEAMGFELEVRHDYRDRSLRRAM